MARYALTIAIRVGLDRSVHLLNVLRSHPPSISQASLGQDLKHKMVPQWGGPHDGEPSEYSYPVLAVGLRFQVTGHGRGHRTSLS